METKYKFKIREYNYVDIQNSNLAKETTMDFDTIESFMSYMKKHGFEAYDKYLYGDYELIDIHEMDDLEEQLEDYLMEIIERVDEFELKGEIKQWKNNNTNK